MSTVINIRGTNGSGKSTVVQRFIHQRGVPGRKIGWGGKLAGYQFTVGDRRIFILGKYETPCGGLDSSFSYPGAAEDVCQCILILAKHGDVICEGAIAMSSYGIARLTRLAATLKANGHHIVFGLMDTPLNVCIDRVKARRATKGNFKPFNPANLAKKYESIHKDQARLLAAGLDCKMISSETAVADLLTILNVTRRSVLP